MTCKHSERPILVVSHRGCNTFTAKSHRARFHYFTIYSIWYNGFCWLVYWDLGKKLFTVWAVFLKVTNACTVWHHCQCLCVKTVKKRLWLLYIMIIFVLKKRGFWMGKSQKWISAVISLTKFVWGKNAHHSTHLHQQCNSGPRAVLVGSPRLPPLFLAASSLLFFCKNLKKKKGCYQKALTEAKT